MVSHLLPKKRAKRDGGSGVGSECEKGDSVMVHVEWSIKEHSVVQHLRMVA